MSFLFPFFKSQIICYYTEEYPISHGFACNGNILLFTNSVDTTIQGEVSASDQIIVIPSQGYGIAILPTQLCESCSDTGGTTIGTKKGGNGGVDKIQKDLMARAEKDELRIEKNPVDDILKLSINKDVLKNIKIYNINGQEVLNKDSNDKIAVIDVSRLTKGVYWVKTMTNENQTYTKQFIKK